MSWFSNFMTSSIGQKIIMSLTGLFLILFLTVHLVGNLQLLYNDSGQAFNIYADMMGNNPVIQLISKGNLFFIALHAIQGILLAIKNKSAKGQKYAVKTSANSSFAARNMAMLGILILAFILMHLGHFWFQMKFGDLEAQTYAGTNGPVKDLYKEVLTIYKSPIWFACYLVGLIALAFHLNHGFASAFQTLGLSHKKYTPFIEFLGKAYSILIPLGFAIIPIVFFFFR